MSSDGVARSLVRARTEHGGRLFVDRRLGRSPPSTPRKMVPNFHFRAPVCRVRLQHATAKILIMTCKLVTLDSRAQRFHYGSRRFMVCILRLKDR